MQQGFSGALGELWGRDADRNTALSTKKHIRAPLPAGSWSGRPSGGQLGAQAGVWANAGPAVQGSGRRGIFALTERPKAKIHQGKQRGDTWSQQVSLGTKCMGLGVLGASWRLLPGGFRCLCACVSVWGCIQGWRRHQARCQLEVPLPAPSSPLLFPTLVRNKHCYIPGALRKSFPPPQSQAVEFTALNMKGEEGEEFRKWGN